MAFEGYIDRASATELSGWIFDNSAPEDPLELEVLDGESVVARITASGFRADLAAAGKGNGQACFFVQQQFTGINAAFRAGGGQALAHRSGGRA